MYSLYNFSKYYFHINWEGEFFVTHSFGIKTHCNQILDYLLNEFENSNISELYISRNVFKVYPNIILHYIGNDVSSFYALVANCLSNAIIKFYEHIVAKKIIVSNYFYFSELERNEILEYCLKELNRTKKEQVYRKNLIFTSCYEYVKENKILILDGFLNFRLKNYIKVIDNTIDIVVDKFIVEREYNEFISLLNMYVESKEPCSSTIHLIYTSRESTLFDENRSLIDTSSHVFDAKYLSDISFSSNDYALNTLLNLLPEKLYIHLRTSDLEDEFINTLKLIFTNRVITCTDCPICHLYHFSDLNLHKLT